MMKSNLISRGLSLLGLLIAGISAAVTIDSVDYQSLPNGETITLSGSDFTGVTKAHFISSGIRETQARVISDTSLEVDYASDHWFTPDTLFVEGLNGSNLVAGADTTQFNEVGWYSEFDRILTIESGAVLEQG